MRPEGQTDMTKLIVTFRNFAKAPKNNYSFAQYGASKASPRITFRQLNLFPSSSAKHQRGMNCVRPSLRSCSQSTGVEAGFHAESIGSVT